MLGSLIAQNSLTAPVRGLDTIPLRDQPPANITHTLRALLLVAALAGVIVIPSSVYLFRLTQSEQWAQDGGPQSVT